MSHETLALQALSKYYTDGTGVVMGLDRITLSFRTGEFVAVTGESGSGKSTLAHILSGVLPYESGELLVDGNPTSHYDASDWERYRRDSVSLVSQDYGILPGASVLENVVSALRLAGVDKRGARVEAERALRRVELWEYRSRRASRLSSGQKQRLAIARALAKPARVLIADEPTGNLDAENSAKVIKLLAEASRERLVILITHDFDEAAAHVTRHVRLHDGEVVIDAPVGASQIKSEPTGSSQIESAPTGASQTESASTDGSASAAPSPKARKRRDLSLYIAALQLRSRPIWCAFLLAFFTLTVAALFAFAGTFFANLDDTPTRIYDDSAFRNGSDRRIVVARPDGEDMTDADAAALLAVEHVASLEWYSLAADVSYASREGVDFEWKHSLNSSGGIDAIYEKVSSVTLDQTRMRFVATVPTLAEGAFLTSGRLPASTFEVVSGDGHQLGETVPVYLQDTKNWSRSAYIYFDATVVGTTEGGGLRFHEDVGRICTAAVLLHGKYIVYIPDETLADDELLAEKNIFEWYRNRGASTFTVSDHNDLQNPESDVEVELIGFHSSSYPDAFAVSPANFDALCMRGSRQFSLTLEHYAYTDRVLEDVHALGYAAVSPYREGSTVQNEELAAERMQTLRLCVIAFVVLMILQVVALRAMFALGTEGYRLLRNVGLEQRTALRSVMWQVLLAAIVSQLLGACAIALCASLGVSQVVELMHYLTAWHVAALSALHLAACALTALWSMHALRRQVYPDASRQYDLDFNDQEVAA